MKNRILTSKRDVNRKIKEIEDALRLNEKFSKEKILVEYLNTVYFGSGSYGIKAGGVALLLHVCDPGAPFGRVASTSTSSPSVRRRCSPGSISNPEGNSPFTHPDRAIRRRADVLRGEVERATSPRPRPTRPTTSRCRRCRRRPRPDRGTDFLTAEVQNSLLNDPRTRQHARRSGCDKISRAG